MDDLETIRGRRTHEEWPKGAAEMDMNVLAAISVAHKISDSHSQENVSII